jgi:hypothetical protein
MLLVRVRDFRIDWLKSVASKEQTGMTTVPCDSLAEVPHVSSPCRDRRQLNLSITCTPDIVV